MSDCFADVLAVLGHEFHCYSMAISTREKKKKTEELKN